MSSANQIDNLAAIAAGDQVHRATGAGAMSETITITRPSKILSMMVHLSSVGATSENLVFAIDSDSGTAYDTVLVTQDMNTVTDYFANTPIYLAPGDDLDITYTNTDASTWGLQVVWGDA
jgi:hypothetical protein